MKPRIYTYKITFPGQGWWYWGAHKESIYGEKYDGSPVTHAEKWECFEFEKQVLEFFDDWETAWEVERRLIAPDLNNPLCLNAGNAGHFDLQALQTAGRNRAKKMWEAKSGAFFDPTLRAIAQRNSREKRSQAVSLEKEGKVFSFTSRAEAAKLLGLCTSGLHRLAHGLQHSHHGYKIHKSVEMPK